MRWSVHFDARTSMDANTRVDIATPSPPFKRPAFETLHITYQTEQRPRVAMRCCLQLVSDRSTATEIGLQKETRNGAP